MDREQLVTESEWANWRRARQIGDQTTTEAMLVLLARGGRWDAIASLARDSQLSSPHDDHGH
ncbi:MAG TPA: hypothetical protein VIQ76_15895 [Propionibacteriaceae bacterium]|jgi:hypothetical protein